MFERREPHDADPEHGDTDPRRERGERTVGGVTQSGRLARHELSASDEADRHEHELHHARRQTGRTRDDVPGGEFERADRQQRAAGET